MRIHVLTLRKGARVAAIMAMALWLSPSSAPAAGDGAHLTPQQGRACAQGTQPRDDLSLAQSLQCDALRSQTKSVTDDAAHGVLSGGSSTGATESQGDSSISDRLKNAADGAAGGLAPDTLLTRRSQVLLIGIAWIAFNLYTASKRRRRRGR